MLVRKEISVDEQMWDLLQDIGAERKEIESTHKEPRRGRKNVGTNNIEESTAPRDKGLHSKLIREMVLAGMVKWTESPYVCLSARHIFFVTRNGLIFYRQVQDLKLRSYRRRLPCTIEMKPEKKEYFLENMDASTKEADWFRSRWLFNSFTVWEKSDHEIRNAAETDKLWVTKQPIGVVVDRKGTDYKMADIPIEQNEGTFLTRETLVCVQDYVQWRGDDLISNDRLDIPIDIPTINLHAVTAIDIELYRDTRSRAQIPHPSVEFRNREGAKFPSSSSKIDHENTMTSRSGRETNSGEILKPVGRPNKEKPCREIVRDELSSLKDRIEQLSTSANRHHYASDDTWKYLLESFVIPKEYLYNNLDWPNPYLGIETCISWQKPVKPADISLFDLRPSSLNGAQPSGRQAKTQSGLKKGK